MVHAVMGMLASWQVLVQHGRQVLFEDGLLVLAGWP